MNFTESVNYLYGLGNEVLAMKLGLDNIGSLLRALGRPHLRYPKVQIAGTNGKGSTVAYLEAMCRAAGIRVGATTSPHLVSVTERIRIDGKEISEAGFARFATEVRSVSEALVAGGVLETVPTYFEQVTAIALLAFADSEVDIAILETGLGGRFDATTAANAGIVAITRIDLDHQRILGNSIAEIAAEKAAIIRAGTVAVIGDQCPEAMTVIGARCSDVNVSPQLAAERISTVHSNDGIVFESVRGRYFASRLSLAGDHQTENARVAILLAEELGLGREAIESGLTTARHRGRLERIGRFLLDGAHNESGVDALAEYLKTADASGIVIVFGAMRDKDIESIAAKLFPVASVVFVTRADNPRSMDVSELARIASKYAADVRTAATVADAIRDATATSEKNDTILVTGSLYLVGEAIREIEGKREK